MSASFVVTFSVCLAGILNVAVATTVAESSLLSSHNPIKAVVRILEDIEAKINKEAEEDKKTYEDYICYCQAKGVKITKEIKLDGSSLDDLEAELNATEAEKMKLISEIRNDKSIFNQEEYDIMAAEKLRGKQAAEFAEAYAELTKNIEALTNAIPAIRKGMPSAFLQTSDGSVLKRLANDERIEMDEGDRDTLTSFLSGLPDETYHPGAGEVVGILGQMKDEMETDLHNLITGENKSVAEYQAILAAKKAEEERLRKAIEEYLARLAADGILIAEGKGYWSDLYRSLMSEEELFKRLQVNCHLRKDEYTERVKSRMSETQAITETIHMLDSDDAKDMFGKIDFKEGAAAASFLQIRVKNKVTHKVSNTGSLRKAALQKLHSKRHHGKGDPRLDLIEVALRGKYVGIQRIIDSIAGLVETLDNEQIADDKKLAWCAAESYRLRTEKEGLELEIRHLQGQVDNAQDKVWEEGNFTWEIYDGIVDDEHDIIRAMKIRKEEYTDFAVAVSNNRAAVNVLEMARDRLNKHYNPKAYHASIGYTELQEEPKDGGATKMIQKIIDDLKLDIVKLETMEKGADAAFEKVLDENNVTRDEAEKLLQDKLAAKAEADQELARALEKLNAEKRDQDLNNQAIHAMGLECDFLKVYYDIRKEARKTEKQGLEQAKFVLAGGEGTVLAETQQSPRRLRGGSAKL